MVIWKQIQCGTALVWLIRNIIVIYHVQNKQETEKKKIRVNIY